MESNKSKYCGNIREILQSPAGRREMEGQGFLLPNVSDFTLFPHDPDTYSQVESRYQTPNVELNLYKRKCEQFQKSINTLVDENRELKLKLAAERSKSENLLRNAEVTLENYKLQHRHELFPMQLEIEKWKQAARSNEYELKIFQDLIQQLKAEKFAAATTITDLQKYKDDAEKYKKNIQIYMQRHTKAENDLKRKINQLKDAEIQLEDFLRAQQKQIDICNLVMPALEEEKKHDAVKIFELEQQILSLQSTNKQNLQQVATLEHHEQIAKQTISQLAESNNELRRQARTLSAHFDDGVSNDDISLLLKVSEDLRSKNEEQKKALAS